MKIGKGVEWAAHACAVLALLPPGSALPREALAEFLGVPDPYLAKQLQALSRAGIVAARRGVAGGYELARPMDAVSLWDVTAALEGTQASFRCTEVRRNGPCGASSAECPRSCEIAAAFQNAEAQFRDALSSVSIADVVAGATQTATTARKERIKDWLNTNAAHR